jgi:hypothetical protein
MLEEEAAIKAARQGEAGDNVAKLPSRPVA